MALTKMVVTLLPVALATISLLVPMKLIICLEDLGTMFFLVLDHQIVRSKKIIFTEETAMTYCFISTVMQRYLVAQEMTYLKAVNTAKTLIWMEAKVTIACLEVNMATTTCLEVLAMISCLAGAAVTKLMEAPAMTFSKVVASASKTPTTQQTYSVEAKATT